MELSNELEQATARAEKASRELREATNDAHDIIKRIKAALPIYDCASRLTELKTSDKGAGRWYRGRCPFHDDQNPSFWIDTERNLWGCHACGERGDVINLYAKNKGVTVNQAIKDLSKWGDK